MYPVANLYKASQSIASQSIKSAFSNRTLSIAGLIAGVIFLSLTVARAADMPYKLGPQDKLRVYVYEWPALTGEFTVGANGRIALPLIGEIEAAGLQPSELASVVSSSLQNKTRLAKRPETSVDVVQYRPFYILGGVERPGEYAFRPGMTVLAAVSIAGGMYRRPDWSYERDVITSAGELRLLALRRNELLAKEARLKAEAEGASAVSFPVDPSKPQGGALPAAVVSKEESIFQARIDKFQNEMQTAQRTIALFQDEIGSLEAQIAADQKQAELVRRELQDVRGFVGRGIAPTTRILPLEQSVAQIEREQREAETTIIRTRQQIILAEQSIVKLRGERRATALTELQGVQGQLTELAQRQETATRIVEEGGAAATSAEASNAGKAVANYAVVRAEGGSLREMNVDELTLLEPGDIIKVRKQTKEPSAEERQTQLSVDTGRGSN